MKPWTRWWWMGNAVDRKNISHRLEEFATAGIGGVEITPIYGVKGYENEFIDHLSAEWIDLLDYTLDEARRLNLKVDMVLGTGWPFGGPQVEDKYAAKKLHIQLFPVSKNEKIDRQLQIEDPEMNSLAYVQQVLAFDQEGNKKDLTDQLDKKRLKWTADNNYRVFVIYKGRTGQQVKRAAPGGKGNVLDHFSEDALFDYLKPYSQSLEPVKDQLRAVFNDSYEVYRADYTADFFTEFKEQRGYDFTDHLPEITKNPSSEESLRILTDYRQTLSDLVLHEFSENWVEWAHKNNLKTKYQAHGCPGNLIDIYATADIPECESFYGTRFDIPGLRWQESDALEAYPDLILLKFASSAAHISGKKLTSSETFTWLREHFKTALSQCKPELEQIFLSGVNHVFFHGSTYYPDEYPWPGWKFYASVNFVPHNTIWKDAPFMFDYISRCQSMLQSGKSDNEILVYWPFSDAIGLDLEGERLLQLGIDNKDIWLTQTDFHEVAGLLMDKGYSVDFVSDDYLQKIKIENGDLQLSGSRYKALVIPETNYMPLTTLKSIKRVHESGAKVIFHELPETVPGFNSYKQKESELHRLTSELEGKLTITEDIPNTLESLGIKRESLKDSGLDFVRRELGDGKMYYLVNHTKQAVDDYLPLNCDAQTVIIMDPLTGITGKAESRSNKDMTEVYVKIKPGDALILRTFQEKQTADDWKYYKSAGNPVELSGEWQLKFLSGGPELPEKKQINELVSWTELGEKAKAFSGTARYTLEFQNPDPTEANWLLELGDVRESARVSINGEFIDCLWSVPFSRNIGKLKEGKNTIEIEVTNLSANRLRDLALRGFEWKNFYEINMVNRHYKEFDAAKWDPMPSGLVGKVYLQPLEVKSF